MQSKNFQSQHAICYYFFQFSDHMRSISYFAFVINVEESLGIPAQFEFMSKLEKKNHLHFV